MEELKTFQLNDQSKSILKSILKEGRNVFITGPGGCGKSYLLKAIKQIANLLYKKKCYLTGTSGVASYNIGGMTIHKFSGIGINKEPEMANSIANKIIKKGGDCFKRWTECQILVIDEISMMGMSTFDLLNDVAKIVRQSPQSFGGLQLVVSGDFFQLPPIKDEMVFKGNLWYELDFKTHCMMNPYRYKDVDYFQTLLRIRKGIQTKNDINLLKQRLRSKIEIKTIIKESQIKPTILFSLKKNVNDMNIQELEKLQTEQIDYKAEDMFKDKILDVDHKKYTEILNNIAPKKTSFKTGAQVMLTANIDVDKGLVNGSRGVIIECKNSSIRVQFVDGSIVTINKHLHEYEDEEAICGRRQIPLILSWSLSIHKIQGCTLDCCVIDLGESIFSDGMAYVALSRVRSLNGLYLSDFDASKITCDEEVKKYYRRYDLIKVYLKHYICKKKTIDIIGNLIVEYLT